MSQRPNVVSNAGPETKVALLMCEGDCRRPTRHAWSHGIPDLPADKKTLIYDCQRCGAPRVWGCESVLPKSP